MKHIVKRAGHEEPYNSEKVFYSVYPACLNASVEDSRAQKIAKKVTRGVDQWLQSRKHVTSDDIFRKVIALLTAEDEQAAFMYETHRDIF